MERRTTAKALWAAMGLGVILFVVVARFVHLGPPAALMPLELAAVVTSLLGVLAAQVLPARVARGTPTEPDARALTAHVLACALCEAPAMLTVVAYLLTRDRRLAWVIAFDLVVFASFFPSRDRWARYLEAVSRGPHP